MPECCREATPPTVIQEKGDRLPTGCATLAEGNLPKVSGETCLEAPTAGRRVLIRETVITGKIDIGDYKTALGTNRSENLARGEHATRPNETGWEGWSLIFPTFGWARVIPRQRDSQTTGFPDNLAHSLLGHANIGSHSETMTAVSWVESSLA